MICAGSAERNMRRRPTWGGGILLGLQGNARRISILLLCLFISTVISDTGRKARKTPPPSFLTTTTSPTVSPTASPTAALTPTPSTTEDGNDSTTDSDSSLSPLPPPMPPQPSPPHPPPSGFAMSPIVRIPQKAEATSVELFFDGADVQYFACQLDGSRWRNCTSPFKAESLVAGSHTFTVNAALDSGAFLAKQHTWQVSPRLQFRSNESKCTLATGTQRTVFLELQTTVDELYVLSSEIYISGIYVYRRGIKSSAEQGALDLHAYGSKASNAITQGIVEVLLDTSKMNVSSHPDYTVELVVEDLKA
ncbi:hypothetical protein CYMTET_16344, partial [Cymbomonas tetramitiformis]